MTGVVAAAAAAPVPPRTSKPDADKVQYTRQREAKKMMAEAQELVSKSEAISSAWRQCSGLHTVSEWVQAYHKHPAGWAALLMIHGVPEVTGRLRSKVENYAICELRSKLTNAI